MNTRTRETAADALGGHLSDIDALIAQLQGLRQTGFGTDGKTVHWGHVGSAAEVSRLMAEAVRHAASMGA